MATRLQKVLSYLATYIAGAISIGFIGIAMAWTGPSSAAPNGNVSVPVNVGTTAQVKNGGLSVNALAVFGNGILSGSSLYLNFGTTVGSTGYGIRDNAGTMEFKNSAGAWSGLVSTSTVVSSIQSYFGSGSSNTVDQIRFADGTTQTTASFSPTVTYYSVSSKQNGTRTVNMGVHAFCALGRVGAGGFNSNCQISQSGTDWLLNAVDSNDSYPDTQSCGAYCF